MGFILGEATSVGWSDLSSVWSVITAQVNLNNILGILAGVVAVAVGLVFAWWGLRKATRVLMSAAKKGRLHF